DREAQGRRHDDRPVQPRRRARGQGTHDRHRGGGVMESLASSFRAAGRIGRIKPSPSTAAAARVRELKAEGRRILDLTVGEPDFDTPDRIKQAAIAAIQAGETKYTPVNGTPQLRDAIRGSLLHTHGIEYSDAE